MPISVKRKLAASHHKGATMWFWFTAGASSSRILYNTTTLAEFALNYLLSLYKLFSRDWRLSLRTLFKKNLTRTHTDPNTKVVYYTWRRSNRTHSNPNTRVEYYTWSRSNRTPPTQTPGQNTIPVVGAAIGPTTTGQNIKPGRGAIEPTQTQTPGQNTIPGVGGAIGPHQPKHQGRILYLEQEEQQDPHQPKHQGRILYLEQQEQKDPHQPKHQGRILYLEQQEQQDPHQPKHQGRILYLEQEEQQDPHQPKHQGSIFYLQEEQYEDPHKPKYQGHQGRMFKTQSKTF